MKALVKAKKARGLWMRDVPEPEIEPNEALIRIRAAGICGTDLHIYAWDKWSRARIKTPLVVGHEFVGDVAALGSEVHHLRVGDRVSGEGHLTCGQCQYCRTGQGHICREVEIIGVDRSGCFAEYLAMPADNIWPVPPAIPDRQAAVFDPLGNAMHTVMSCDVAGRSVLVTGAGAIGLFAVPIVKGLGASPVIVVEPLDYRRRIAKKVGADLALNPESDGVDKKVLDLTEGLGAEVLLEMSGKAGAIHQGLQLLRNGGEASMLGIPPGPIKLDLAEDVIFKGITLHGVNGRRIFDTWYQSQAFLLKTKGAIDPVITHVFDFEDYEKGFDLLFKGKAGKVVLTLPGTATMRDR